ncbi:MAG TPA: metal ABC transporter permease [Gemmatimonadales bacterium]|nr:metal ABC transporter permease [Gemmatimonadales bacterium]
MTIGIVDLALPAATAAAAGLVGSFAVLRRLALASDALSHVALPGIGVALLLHANPLLGGVVALVLGAALIWLVQRRTRLPTEAVVGVIFSAGLAVGSLFTSGEELLEALLGSSRAAGPVETGLSLGAAAAIVAWILSARHRLLLALLSEDLARTAGIRVERLDLVFLLVFALTTALGLRYLGILLMGSLIIIPAATARLMSRRLDRMLLTAVLLSVGATLAGTLAASRFGLATGPVIIALAAALFGVGVLLRRRG